MTCTNVILDDDTDEVLGVCGDDEDLYCDQCRKDDTEYALYEWHRDGCPRPGDQVDYEGMSQMDRLMTDPSYYDRTVGF